MPGGLVEHDPAVAPLGMEGLPELWQQTLGDDRIRIAVLDGPVDTSHPSLTGARLTLLPAVAPAVQPDGLAAEHGTHVSSIIFGRHDGPVKGIAPGCRGLAVPIFHDGADGTITPCSQSDLARAITRALAGGAHVINVSGGEFAPFATAHPLLADAARQCAERGALLVAAAGNNGCDCLQVPGALPSVLAVGAMNGQGEPLEFSNWGAAYRAQGLLAPGENIPGAGPSGGTVARSGTSYAAPIVSGIAGLLMSLQLRQGLSVDAQAVRAALLETAQGCEHKEVPDCRRLLAGRLNLRGAVSRIFQGVSNMTDPKLPSEHQPLEPSQHPESVTAEVAAEAPASAGDARPAEAARDPAPIPRSRNCPSVSPPGHVPAGARVRVQPADGGGCSCGGGGPLVYALGALAYDVGSLARQDSIQSEMPDSKSIHNAHDVLEFLSQGADEKPPNYSYAQSIIWTLNQESTPIYAIRPSGAFASEGYEFLREAFDEQIHNKSEIVAIPGTIAGGVRLYSGQTVPVVCPEVRGLRNWTIGDLVDCVKKGQEKQAQARQSAQPRRSHDDDDRALRNYLTRIYYEFRNLGQEPQERALNFTGTNAFVVDKSFEAMAELGLVLDEIDVVRSPICRPDSDCWDVRIFFFNPVDTLSTPRTVFRITVDVSDVVPVIVGEVRQWEVR